LHPSTLAKRVQNFLFLAFIFFYFYGLGHLPLVGPDEPRYAQVTREMLLHRDWITPTLGGHTWFEKPALLYWMIIPAFKIFGLHEWSARLGPAICGLLTIAAVWWLAQAIERSSSSDWKGYGNWSALVAASCLGMIVFSRGASFDIVITMTSTWALSFFMLSELADVSGKQTRFLIGFYFFVGLSLIAKGLVGFVIPFGVVGLYFLLIRAWPRQTLWFSLSWGLPLALLVSSVWYGPVIYKHGWHFINEFFVQHHFARYLSNKYHHPQPLYFYPAILLLLTVPWTAFLLDAFIGARHWHWRAQDSTSRSAVFLLAWVLFPIVFFSFSVSKLPAYILPVLPAAAMLTGRSVIRFEWGQVSKWSMKATGALCLVMGLAGLVYGVRVERLSLSCSLLSTLSFLLAGIVALFWNRPPSVATRSIAGSVLIAVLIVLNCAAFAVARRESTRDLLALADSRGYSGLPVLAMHGDDRSAEFYASGRVIYGPDGEVIALDEAPLIVDAVRKRHEKILAFIPAEDIGLFTGKPGIEVVGDNGKQALLCLY
jgi:4-amino-4-deoxy-L-arabinose transferase-like glycosyltransferase